MRTHPHAEATYRVIPWADGAFAVEVLVPDTQPATVSSFVTEEAAETWIARHKALVEAGPVSRGGFRGARRNP